MLFLVHRLTTLRHLPQTGLLRTRCRLFVLLSGLLLGLLSLPPETALAQQKDTTRTEQIRPKDIKSQTDMLEGGQKKDHAKDKKFYKNLKGFFSKNKFLRGIYDLLFREPPSASAVTVQPKPKITNPNKRYDGKIIGKITVQRIGIFGPRVYDTLRTPQNWLERTGNRIHFDTRKDIIKNTYLLFSEGSTVDHQMLVNNERIMRTSPNLLDARILVVPRPHDKDTVDILVITQDVWSISAEGGVSGNSGDLALDDKNLFGWGHELRTGFRYSSSLSQRWSYRARYTIPYIGKTFISGEAEYVNEWNDHSYALRFRKPFLAPTIKYAGGLELSQNRILVPILFPTDTINLYFPLNFHVGDLWVGRAFRFYSGSENFQKSSRLVLSSRIIRYGYSQRPEVKPDTSLYQDRTTGLLSIGFSRRNYFRDVLIYGFGRTEDVPYGSLFTLTSGMEKNEVGNRMYGGIRMDYAQYFDRIGYLYGSVNLGSYFRGKKSEQGAVNVGIKYFSPLIGSDRLQVRQFFNVSYRQGFDRFYNEGLDINNSNGIRGISSDGLRGTKSVVFNLETVFFTPGNVLGFRFALFTYADIGLVTRPGRALFNQNPYQGYGIGIRVRNENLAFNTFQIRIGYYPNIPENNILWRSSFSGIPSLRLYDLSVTAPEVVPFR